MFQRLHQRLDRISSQLERIDVILTIKDPGGAKAAEAYEGLRLKVVASAQERLNHLGDLARIDAALHDDESSRDLALLLRDLMGQTNLERVDQPGARDLYHVTGEGDRLTVTAPAYVDAVNGRLVHQGRASASAGPTDIVSETAVGDIEEEVRS